MQPQQQQLYTAVWYIERAATDRRCNVAPHFRCAWTLTPAHQLLLERHHPHPHLTAGSRGPRPCDMRWSLTRHHDRCSCAAGAGKAGGPVPSLMVVRADMCPRADPQASRCCASLTHHCLQALKSHSILPGATCWRAALLPRRVWWVGTCGQRSYSASTSTSSEDK
jgi:hypothetical protein